MSEFISNSFQIPNALVDELIATMTAADLKCYLVIVRKTVGWQKQTDRISITQFMKITGLSNRAVITACANLEEVGLVRVIKDGKGNKSYSLVRSAYEESSRGEKSSRVKGSEESSPHEESSLPKPPKPMKKVHGGSEESSWSASEESSHTKDTLTKDTNTKESSARTRKLKTSIPADFKISEAVAQWASEKGFTHLQQHLESFVDKCQAKGYQYSDWDAAFRDAVRKNWAGLGQTNQQRQDTSDSMRQTESPAPDQQSRISLFSGLELIKFTELRALKPEMTQIQVRELAKHHGIDVFVLMDRMVKKLKAGEAA